MLSKFKKKFFLLIFHPILIFFSNFLLHNGKCIIESLTLVISSYKFPSQSILVWGAFEFLSHQLLAFLSKDKGGPRLFSVEGKELPPARLVSTTMSSVIPRETISLNTLLVMQWGQYIDHDLTFTPEPEGK